jgi:hypothetical protein
MSLLPLPSQTLAWLKHAADAGQCEPLVLLHLIARADKRDQDVGVFVNSYSKTIAALCRRLEALERGAGLRHPVEDAEAAHPDSVADTAQRITDYAAKAGMTAQDWARAFSAALVPRQALAATPTSAASTPLPAALVERVASAMGPSTQAAMDAGELPFGTASTAIREVAAWLDTRGQHGCSYLLREEIDQ